MRLKVAYIIKQIVWLKRWESWSLLLDPSLVLPYLVSLLCTAQIKAHVKAVARGNFKMDSICVASLCLPRRTFAMNTFTQGKSSRLRASATQTDRKAARRNSLAHFRWARWSTARTSNGGSNESLFRSCLYDIEWKPHKRVCLGSGGEQGPCGAWRQQCGKERQEEGADEMFPSSWLILCLSANSHQLQLIKARSKRCGEEGQGEGS